MSDASFDHDYTAATESVGARSLDRWTTIRVTGNDRASFLHNMCTNDIKGLSPGSGCEAFFTDVKGRVVAHAFVLAGEDVFQLVTVPEQAPRIIVHLDRYIIREDVQLSDASSEVEWSLILVGAAKQSVGWRRP